MIAALTDIVILTLLAGMLAYAWLLDRRIRRLMFALRDMQPLIWEFSNAVDRSQDAISALSGVSGLEDEVRTPDVPREKSDLVRDFFDRSRRQK